MIRQAEALPQFVEVAPRRHSLPHRTRQNPSPSLPSRSIPEVQRRGQTRRFDCSIRIPNLTCCIWGRCPKDRRGRLKTHHPITQKRTQLNAISFRTCARRVEGKPTRRSIVTIWERSCYIPRPFFIFTQITV